MDRFVSTLFCLVILPEVATAQPQDMLANRVASLEIRVANLEARMAPASTLPAVTQRPPVTVVPPGHHTHTTVDGRTIVHADSNYGNAAAHAGVAWPWPKTAVAGQAVYTGGTGLGPTPGHWYGGGYQGVPQFTTVRAFAADDGSCPGGNCPAGRTRVFAPFGGRFRR